MAKRFTFADGFTIVAIKDDGEIMNSRQVCETLNSLSEENKSLKRRLMIAEDKVKGLMK